MFFTGSPLRKTQSVHLLALTLVHAAADMIPGMIPALLPALRNHFALSLTAGLGVLSVLNLVCNAVQIATGHLRSSKTNPLFIPIGSLLALTMLLMIILPADRTALPWLYALAIISAIGVALVHPEGLRAVHALDALPGSVSTAIFLTGGFFGFAGGAWLSSALVSRWGFHALGFLAIITFLSLGLFSFLRIRLAVETVNDDVEVLPANSKPVSSSEPITFWSVLGIAIPTAIGSTLVAGLLPSRLNELGFSLTYGGLASLLFGAGTTAGSLVWSVVAHRKGELPCATLVLLVGSPFLILFLLFLAHPIALILLVATGFFAGAAFSLLVSQARRTPGPVLGTRMALIVGGTWGVSSILLMALGPVAEKWGIQPVLHLAWISFLVAGIQGWRLWQKSRRYAQHKN